MGCGTSGQTSSTWNDQTSQTTFAEASPEEKALREQFATLGTQQIGTLSNLMNQSTGGGSAFAMTPADQAQLDQAFNAAQQRLQLQGKDYADFLSGGRGLRMSDTPIAQQALDRFGLGMADLQSQRAMAGLNLGLAANQWRSGLGLAASQAMPSGSLAAFQPLFGERMSSGTTHAWGTGNTDITKNDSIMTQILQGSQANNQNAQAGAAIMSMFSDERLKQDIQPVRWNWKTGGDEEFGVIAQEVEKSHPHLVSRDENGYLKVHYGVLTAMLLDERRWLYEKLNAQVAGMSYRNRTVQSPSIHSAQRS